MADPKNSQQALSQLQKAQKTSLSPNDILSSQRQQLGVQGAQDTVTGLRQAINNTTQLLKNVAPSVMGRTGSSLVTNAQATRQIANEQQPLYQTLGEQGNNYDEAGRQLNELNARATEAATGAYQQQQDRNSYLQNLYSTLYGREQDAYARRQAELDRREQIRQFNANLAAQRSATAATNRQFDLFGGGGKVKGGSSSDILGNVKYRVPGDKSQGFAFTDSRGNPINALEYSQSIQIPFRKLLQQMAKRGDVGAKAGLKFIGKDGNADPTKVTNRSLANLYMALTGRGAPIPTRITASGSRVQAF